MSGAVIQPINEAGSWLGKARKLRRRLNARLLEEEFEQVDQAVVQAAQERLVGVGDLLARNRHDIGSLGVLKSTFVKTSGMDAAEFSMTGRSRVPSDSVEKEQASVPLPMAHKDFNIGLRELEASRQGIEALDDTEFRGAARQISELIEQTLFLGGPTFAGNGIPGYTTHGDRNTVSIGTNWDDETNPGDAALADVLSAISALDSANYSGGPLWVYVPTNYGTTVLEDDFKAETEATTRERLERITNVQAVRVADKLTDDNVVVVRATRDVVDIATFQEPDLIEREQQLEFELQLKVWAIMIPRVKSDKAGNSGVAHIS